MAKLKRKDIRIQVNELTFDNDERELLRIAMDVAIDSDVKGLRQFALSIIYQIDGMRLT